MALKKNSTLRENLVALRKVRDIRASKMGWVWRDDTDDSDSFAAAADADKFNNSTSPSSSDWCSTRNVVRSHCKTEEVEPGKFVRKCERTEEILRDCIGRYVRVCFSYFCFFLSLLVLDTCCLLIMEVCFLR